MPTSAASSDDALARPLDLLAAIMAAAKALQFGEMERMIDVSPQHVRALLAVAIVEAGRAGRDNETAVEFLRVGRQVEHVVNRRCGFERQLGIQRRHAQLMQADREGLRQAIFVHFKRSMAEGREPSDFDLELWGRRGITPERWWPLDVEVQAPDPIAAEPPPIDYHEWATEAFRSHAGELWRIPPPPTIVAGSRGNPVCAVSGKLCFDSEESAAKYRKLTRRHSASERSIRSYLCPHCDTWHNTSQEAYRACPDPTAPAGGC